MEKIASQSKEINKQFKEIAAQSKETDKQFKETDKQFKETDRQFKEIAAQSRKTDKQFERLLKTQEKTDKKFRQLRHLGINIGFAVEDFFYESFKKNPVMGKIHFDDISRKVRGKKFEFDIVLYNDDSIGIIEVKHRLRSNVVGSVLGKICKFKEEFHQYKNFKIYAGLAAYSFDQDSDELAQKRGLYVFARYGRKLLIKNKDDFKARVF